MPRNLNSPLNFHNRNKTDTDFEPIKFGRHGRVIYTTETHVNNPQAQV